MDIAWGIEVLAKKDFFSGEGSLRLIDHPMENQSSEDSNSIKDNVAKPKKDFCQGPESRDGMEVQAANLNRTTKTRTVQQR